MIRTTDEKYKTVIDKNTLYFFNNKFEEKYEGYINAMKETLLIIKNRVETEGLKKEIFEQLLLEKENGLKALLSLTGFSNEYFKRLITIIRIVDNNELNKLVYRDQWYTDTSNDIKEWSDKTIQHLISSNIYFRRGIVNIFFEGASVQFLAEVIPLFELKKLSIAKLRFDVSELIDTLIRYKEKGSYSGMKENNPEIIVEELLHGLSIPFDKGDLRELISNAPNEKRTMDFIIPNKYAPLIVVESSFLVTTSSGQGDKSKTEIAIDALLKEHYPNSRFIGFIDGIGWYVRKKDLRRMVNAYEDVFTFHKDELLRFEKFLRTVFGK
jgi:hypothetical protein